MHRQNDRAVRNVVYATMSYFIKQTFYHMFQFIRSIVFVELIIATRWRIEITLDNILGAHEFFEIEVGKVYKFPAVGQSSEGKPFEIFIFGEIGKFAQPRFDMVLPEVI